MKLMKLLLVGLALLFWPAAAEARIMALLAGAADYNEPSGIHASAFGESVSRRNS